MGDPSAMGDARTLLSTWAAQLFEGFADAGVEEIVLSPGSRSTPFVAAACGEPRLRCHDVVDERAAAFFALGQARLTGKPSVLVCTSGTAAAHYFPAVIEAAEAGIPLVVVTADRPRELLDCGAPQTIDQTKLFGGYVRRAFDLGAADERALAAVTRIAAQSVTASLYPKPGPVHVNAPARKPLEPAEADAAACRPTATKVVLPVAVIEAGALDEIARVCDAAERGLVVCGPMPASFVRHAGDVFALARRLGFPVLAETASQLRLFEAPPDGVVACDRSDVFLRAESFRRVFVPDVVVQIGRTPTSTAWEQLVARHPSMRRIVLSEHDWIDPSSDAAFLVLGAIGSSLRALSESVRGDSTSARATWAAALARAESVAACVVDDEVAHGAELSEGSAVRAVVDALPRGSVFVLGNSLPIRTADTFGRRRGAEITVLSQRGANGIDGLVAGAAGAASIVDRPVTLLLGDVSLLHDLTSLGLARSAAAPFVVVVVNNQGGRIFEQLPLGTVPAGASDALRAKYEATLAHVCTSHATDFEAAARTFGLRHRRVRLTGELAGALDEAYRAGEPVLVEIAVPPSGARAQVRRLWERTEAALKTLR